MKEQIEILEELLELTIKAGRRMMHDYHHMLNEIPKDNIFKEEYSERGKVWESIFYPDDGPKNYRTRLHQELMWKEIAIERLEKQIKELGATPDNRTPF